MAKSVLVSIALCAVGVVVALAAPRPDPQFPGLPFSQLPVGNFSSVTDYNEYLSQITSLYQNQTANIPFANAVNPNQLPFNPSQLPFNPSQLPSFPNLGGGGGGSDQQANLSNMLAYNEYLTQIMSLYQNQTANIPGIGGNNAGAAANNKEKE